MATHGGSLTFMNRINVMFNCVEHEICHMNLGTFLQGWRKGTLSKD